MADPTKTKPCADCGSKAVVETAQRAAVSAAGTYDLLISWGVTEDAASAAVELGVRATSAHDPKSVLAAALAASDERARVCEEEYVRLEAELQELSDQYNTLQEAFEGHYSDVSTRLDKEVDGEYDEGSS